LQDFQYRAFFNLQQVRSTFSGKTQFQQEMKFDAILAPS